MTVRPSDGRINRLITIQSFGEPQLLCSAFEHILDAESKAIDVANRFTTSFTPTKSKLVRDATRRSTRWRDEGQPLRFEWMREFYRIRGDFAHGQLQSKQDTVWGLGEHLVLGTIAFPLLVRLLLMNAGEYTLTDEDVAQIDAFEALADTPRFTYPPTDARNSLDSHWKRVRRTVHRSRVSEQIIAELKAKDIISPTSDPENEQ
jgi:hypothetical protein